MDATIPLEIGLGIRRLGLQPWATFSTWDDRMGTVCVYTVWRRQMHYFVHTHFYCFSFSSESESCKYSLLVHTVPELNRCMIN